MDQKQEELQEYLLQIRYKIMTTLNLKGFSLSCSTSDVLQPLEAMRL